MCIAIAGMAGFVLPILIWPPAKTYDAPLFPLVRTAVEVVNPASFATIFVVGCVAGLVCRLPVKVIGLAAMTLFPLAAFAEIAKDGTSHNMIPFEIVAYAIYSIVTFSGGFLGRGLRRLTPLGS
jgi:hypothetical protein